MPAANKGAGSSTPLNLKRLEELEVVVPIIGVTPLIPHRWSEKARNQLRIAQSGELKPPKEPKDAAASAHAATYWIDEAETLPGMPSVAFKAAMVGAARFFDNLTMTEARLLFFVGGTVVSTAGEYTVSEMLVPIVTGKGIMREDLPRNANGNPDLRYRMQFWPWEAELRISYMPSKITTDSVVALVDAAGRGGVGEWRPSAPKSATGTYGQFRVKED